MTRSEFYVRERLNPLAPMGEVIMTLEGDYRVKFGAIPSETAIAELEFQVVKREGKHFILRDLRPPTNPVLMNESETRIHKRLSDHYGHIGSVMQAEDGYVVKLAGGVLDEPFLADVVRKTGLLVISHNHSSFTVRDQEGQDAYLASEPRPEPPLPPAEPLAAFMGEEPPMDPMATKPLPPVHAEAPAVPTTVEEAVDRGCPDPAEAAAKIETPDLVTAAPPPDASALRLADLQTCVNLQRELLNLLEGRLAEAHDINRSQANLIRTALAASAPKSPRPVEVCTLVQNVDTPFVDRELQRERNAGWQIVHIGVTSDKGVITRTVTLERDLPDEPPQPEQHAAAGAARRSRSSTPQPLLSREARNGGRAPAPRPDRIIEHVPPLEVFAALPNAQALRRDGIDAFKAAKNAALLQTVGDAFSARQAARATYVAPNPFRIPSSVGGGS